MMNLCAQSFIEPVDMVFGVFTGGTLGFPFILLRFLLKCFELSCVMCFCELVDGGNANLLLPTKFASKHVVLEWHLHMDKAVCI